MSNIDQLLWDNPYNPNRAEAKRLAYEQRMKDRRRMVVLDDGRVIFKCGEAGCNFTVGSVGKRAGQPCFKINLKGSRTPRETNADFVRCADSRDPRVPQFSYDEAPDSVTKSKSAKHGGLPRYEHDSPNDNTGGKCQCGCIHKFFFEEMAQSLGFANCEEATMIHIAAPNELASSAYNLAAKFLAVYVSRADVDLVEVYRACFAPFASG